MKQVWKFPLPVTGVNVITMPAHAEVLAFQLQDTAPTIWAKVDPIMMKMPRKFFLAGTGWDLPPDNVLKAYHGTVQAHGLVWHLFELRE